jgi:hypothetical protein
MGLGDIYKARRQPPQSKVAKPPLIPAHVKAALAAERAKAPRFRAPASRTPQPAKPRAQKQSQHGAYWQQRRAEDEARGRATMAAITQAADAPQAKPTTEQQMVDPFAKTAAEVVETFAVMVRR